MGAEERVNLIQQMSVAVYWRNKHANRLDELIFKALEEGFTAQRIARIVGVSRDTIERHYTARRGRQFANRPPPSPEAAEKVRRERISNVLLRPHGG